MRARPLHRYRMMGYEIVTTEQMDLHLLKMGGKILVKPLPEWILSYEFWETWICGDEVLHRSACGFILSYIWLLVTPIDLKIAEEFGLIPSCITWPWWKSFVQDFLGDEPGRVDINTLAQVNKRYQFGDLRLGRINSIYRSRFFWTHFVRGYLYGYNRYVVFFQRKFGWLLIVGVFFSLVSLPRISCLTLFHPQFPIPHFPFSRSSALQAYAKAILGPKCDASRPHPPRAEQPTRFPPRELRVRIIQHRLCRGCAGHSRSGVCDHVLFQHGSCDSTCRS
jgi:hypothetical protein